MQQFLSFGLNEQTVSQREEIVEQVLKALKTNYRKPSLQLLAMYDRYIIKEVDLYAVNQLVYKKSLKEYKRFMGVHNK